MKWLLFIAPIGFGLAAILCGALFSHTAYKTIKFRYFHPRRIMGTVVNIKDNVHTFVAIKNSEGQQVVIRNTMTGHPSHVHKGDSISVLYFQPDMSDAVMDDFDELEGCTILTFFFFIGSMFIAIFLLPILFPSLIHSPCFLCRLVRRLWLIVAEHDHDLSKTFQETR